MSILPSEAVLKPCSADAEIVKIRLVVFIQLRADAADHPLAGTKLLAVGPAGSEGCFLGVESLQKGAVVPLDQFNCKSSRLFSLPFLFSVIIIAREICNKLDYYGERLTGS